MSDVKAWFRRAVEGFGGRLEAVPDDQWAAPTPNAGWDVRALAAHVVDEQLWAPPLLAGRTIDEIGDEVPADPLGDDPVAAWRAAAGAGLAAADAVELDATVHLSFGDVDAEEYLMQLLADHLVHAWDLARSTGQDERLDPALVAAVTPWFDERETLYRSAGVIAEAVAVDGDDLQDRLVARTGRDPSTDSTLAALVRFNAAFGSQDVDGIMAAMTDDCAFCDTTPPDGTAHEGQEAVRAAWEALFAANPDGRFTTEEGVITGDRATFRWVYDWGDGHVRGVDVFRVRDGKVAENRSYVKG